MGYDNSENPRSIFFCFPFFCGKKPKNKKRSAKSPEIETAPMAADGPGTDFTSMPSSEHFLSSSPESFDVQNWSASPVLSHGKLGTAFY